MKNRSIYIFFRLVTILTRGKINAINDYAKKYGYLSNIDKYRNKGAVIGDNTLLINCTLSSSNKGDKFFIGNNCTLTGTTLLGHDASPTLYLSELVVKDKVYLPGSRLSYRNPITIGHNVFIGWGTIVLPGVTIGDNVVIGAGSIVSKNIPANSVAVGNPAKVIKHIDEYIKDYRETLVKFPDRF